MKPSQIIKACHTDISRKKEPKDCTEDPKWILEQIDRLLEKTIKAGNEGFPPYNIELSDESNYKITLAVAGFREEELTVSLEDRQLIITGKQVEKENGVTFIHRGIAARHFQKNFVLAEGVEIEGAELEKGLLSIFLIRKNLELRVKSIKIIERS